MKYGNSPTPTALMAADSRARNQLNAIYGARSKYPGRVCAVAMPMREWEQERGLLVARLPASVSPGSN
jgi:hypothetical protein